MKTDDFIKLCINCGYAKKSIVLNWCEENPKDNYTYDDLIFVYRYAESPKKGGRKYGWRELKDGNRTTINNIHRGLAGNSRWNQDC